MLKVHIILDSFGSGIETSLATIEIANNLSHKNRPTYGNYTVRLIDKEGNEVSCCHVKNHKREAGFMSLVAKTVKKLTAITSKSDESL